MHIEIMFVYIYYVQLYNKVAKVGKSVTSKFRVWKKYRLFKVEGKFN